MVTEQMLLRVLVEVEEVETKVVLEVQEQWDKNGIQLTDLVEVEEEQEIMLREIPLEVQDLHMEEEVEEVHFLEELVLRE